MQLFPVQEQFVDSDAHCVAFLADHGSGKTMAGAIKAIRKILQGKSGVIVSPSFPYLVQATFHEFRKWAPWDLLEEKNRGRDHPYTTQKILKFVIDGKEVRVYYGAADRWFLRGLSHVDWVWFDGIEDIPHPAFQVLYDRVQRGDHPQVWVTGEDPEEEHHWLDRYFRRGPLVNGETSRAISGGEDMRDLSDCFPVHEQYNLNLVSPEQRALIMKLYPALCQDV
jgi:hypothetical protein